MDKNTGDTGFVSRSNTRRETIAFSVDNLSDKIKDVRSFYPLPVSEQEELEIDFRFNPPMDAENVDDKRGVAAWDMTLQPGEKQTVEINIDMTWPEGQELRWSP